MKINLSCLVAKFQVFNDPETPGWYVSNALGVNCTLNLPSPSSVKPFHIAAAAPEQSISWPEAPSEDMEQSCRELPSLMVEMAHHNIPGACKNNQNINS